MARPKRFRVDGPYPHGRRFRVRLVGSGKSRLVSFDTLSEAEAYAQEAREQAPEGRTVGQALGAWKAHLADEDRPRGACRPITINDYQTKIKLWLDLAEPLSMITPERISEIYADKRASLGSVASQHDGLRVVKLFLRWCVEAGHIASSPAEEVQYLGRAPRRKAPIRRIGEAQRFSAKAVELAQEGDRGAIATLMALWCGMRSLEVRCRRVGDLDYDAEAHRHLLWIDQTKTEEGERYFQVPDDLAEMIHRHLAAGKDRDAYLFDSRSKDRYLGKFWFQLATARIAAAAGVPRVTPQNLRAMSAWLATEAGATAALVTQQLGHRSFATTKGHYLPPGTESRMQARAALKVLSGGKV
jgi:integrase